MSSKVRVTLQTLQVLSVLLEQPLGQHYGLEISRSAGLPTGSIYPILARLEHAGWISSEWEDPQEATEGRPRRRYYQLTRSGAQLARRAVEDAQARLSGTPQPPSQRRFPEPGEAPA
jgi:PadR family transcriptional regulator PadR